MSGPTNALLAEGNRILREIAAQQGAAYRAYSEALQRFADSRIGLTELLKSSADIYAKEAGRTAWSLIHAGAGMSAWMLSLAGARSPRQETVAKPDAKPVNKQTQRGRR